MKVNLADLKKQIKSGNVGSIKGLKKVSKQHVKTLKLHQKTLQKLQERTQNINQQFSELQNYQNRLRKLILSMKRISSVIQEQKNLKAKTTGMGKQLKKLKKTDTRFRNKFRNIHKWDRKVWDKVRKIKTFLIGNHMVGSYGFLLE